MWPSLILESRLRRQNLGTRGVLESRGLDSNQSVWMSIRALEQPPPYRPKAEGAIEGTNSDLDQYKTRPTHLEPPGMLPYSLQNATSDQAGAMASSTMQPASPACCCCASRTSAKKQHEAQQTQRTASSPIQYRRTLQLRTTAWLAFQSLISPTKTQGHGSLGLM